MKSYSMIGLMSGTSMDGLDIAHCTFSRTKEARWNYELHQAETAEYPKEILSLLANSRNLGSSELMQLDKTLGQFYADCVNLFLRKYDIPVSSLNAIASHGHTVFHQPDKGYTLQIGCGETLSVRTGIPVINDFRQKDVIEGGQGAPLVPIGDTLLFSSQADAFVNIGGFCNVCFTRQPPVAYDICPGNLPLNTIASRLGLDFDRNGTAATSGQLIDSVLDKLNSLPFYRQAAPKSLGTEWLEEFFMPVISGDEKPEDLLHTVTEHIAIQIGKELSSHGIKSAFFSGGGAKNTFLLERIVQHYQGRLIIPEERIIDFKEALIFGFLGALYLANEPNCLAAVTGARRNVKGGVLHLP